MQEGILVLKNPGLAIQLPDGTEHVVTEADYVECLQSLIGNCAQFFPLHQEQADGLWYFDSVTPLHGLPARFRQAEPGERRKRGILTTQKGKLQIELWDNTTQEIADGTELELNLPRQEADPNKTTVKMTWQRATVALDSAKKWRYVDMFGRSHALEHEQFARIAV